uniref:receptor protein-tyrosine kinase n=1 Tax=Schistosoma mansoni TaxID=6183 RepID=A0A5K4FB04_SCHMA
MMIVKNKQIELNQSIKLNPDQDDHDVVEDVEDDQDDQDDELIHGNHLHEINYYKDNPKYENKIICKSKYTWRDISLPWKILMKNFNPNCTHILGNLIISGVDEDDDVTLLENIEEISGYLVIYGVGRKELRLSHLKLIKGHEWIIFKSRKVALLVVSNYKQNDLLSSSNVSSQSTSSVNDTGKQRYGLSHLQSLEMTSFISVVQHGIYFYDNPGLCYTPFTLKWDEMIESSELQTIDLYALHSNDNITLWLEYCQCKYLNKCMNIMNSNERSEEPSSINVSHILQSKHIYNELLKNTDDELKGRNIQKRDIHINSMNQSIVDAVNEFHQDDLNTTNLSSDEQTTHPMSQTENINKDPDPLNSNQIQSNSLSNNNEDTLEYQNMVQNDIFMPKIGSKLNEMYIDDNNLASDIIDDETTTAAMATPFENYTSSEVLNESYSTTTMDDTNISVTTNIETITPSNKISVLTTYSTIDLPSYENTTSSITVISNERIHDDNHTVKMNLSKIDNKSIMNYSMEYPSLPCHTSCPLIQGKRYCWGPGRDQCQAVHKCQIRLCEGSNWCFRTKSNEYYQKNLTYYKMNFITSSKEQCCHSECAASCYGPRARDCNACLRLSNRGVCTDSCPASKKYNKSTFSWVENPDGLLTFGMICVKSCPKTYLRDDDHCVSKCARPGYMTYQGECIPCPNSICPKICTLNEIESIKGIDYLHRKSLHAMENCTVFEGDIKLSMQSFIGDPFYNLSQIDEGVKWKDLIIGLSKLEYITGTLYISAGSHAPWMTNLTFLSNVKIIGGISPNIQQTRTVNINLNHHLEFLGMTSLQKLGHPSLLITGNPRLCYVDTIDWTSLLNDETFVDELHDKGTKISKLIKTFNTNLNNDSLAQIILRHKKDSKRKRPFKDSTIFVGGNAHFEFCKGRGAVCDELCQPHSGCWGPGRQFCTLCKYWSIENIDNGGRICMEHCEDLPGFYTPKLNDTHSNLEQMITDRSNIMIDVQNLSTAVYNNEINKSTTELINKYYSKENKIFSSAQCKKCSDMCSLQNQTCYGPNDDQCIGLCRFVQDGPFCRAYCPPNKYTDPITKKCMECSSTCTPPGDIENGNIYINNNLLNQKIENKLKYYCTGSGDWPGNGGCSFCKQTVLYLEPKNSNHHLKCVNSCPFGTYQHVINLHHRGGSSVDRQSTVSFNIKEQNSSMNRFTWSQTDANLFHNFPSKIIDEISLWLLNHTQPQLYGLAQICLPCNEQCHSEIISSRQSSLIGSSNVACYGPSPEQCVRCAYASYQGRCVSTCPSGTYPKKKSLRNFDPTLLNDYYIGYLPDNITSFECLSCHKECEIGCSGPTAEECTRCRHVKIYHDSQMKSWLCNNTCPDFSPFKIFDQKTGEIICSSDSINLHIIPYYNGQYSIENHLNSTILHNSYNNNIVTMATKNLNFLQNIHMMNYNNIWHYHYLSTQTAGLISSLSALFIMLLLLSLIIYWTIYKRSKYIRIEQYDTTINTTDNTTNTTGTNNNNNNKGNKSCFISLNKICEKFWTQGKPQLVIKKKKKEKNKEKRKKSKTFTIATKNHRSILNYKNNQLIKEKLLFHPLNWNHSLIPMNGSLLLDKDNKWMNNMDEEKSPTHSESLKPNMATLRIITESELIRGPLIGSGAFGTVYCGVWCPKFTRQKLDPINNDTYSTITNSTITPTSNVFNSKKFDWDKNTNGTETIPGGFNNDNYFNLHIPVAIKVLSDSADPQTNKELLEEAKVMATVDHPCCVRFLALCLTSKLQLITQYLPLGSLLEFIKIRWDFIEVNSLFQWSEQIASGMIYLSSRGIIHRDLAARNVLVQSKDQVQITDFGLAKCLDTTHSEYHASGGRMPIKWLAIECIQDRIFSSKSDVWAYGITLWEMCTFGHRPYENIHAKNLLDFLEKGNRLPQPETTSLDFYCLMLQCWQADPNLRPTFKELCSALCEMKATPNRYLFITPELRTSNFTNQDTSQNALEFLTSCLTDTTISLKSTHTNISSIQSYQQIYNDLNEYNNHSLLNQLNIEDYTQYTQMNYDWLNNLYVNSRINLLPEEYIQTLLNNYNYLIGINTTTDKTTTNTTDNTTNTTTDNTTTNTTDTTTNTTTDNTTTDNTTTNTTDNTTTNITDTTTTNITDNTTTNATNNTTNTTTDNTTTNTTDTTTNTTDTTTTNITDNTTTNATNNTTNTTHNTITNTSDNTTDTTTDNTTTNTDTTTNTTNTTANNNNNYIRFQNEINKVTLPNQYIDNININDPRDNSIHHCNDILIDAEETNRNEENLVTKESEGSFMEESSENVSLSILQMDSAQISDQYYVNTVIEKNNCNEVSSSIQNQ